MTLGAKIKEARRKKGYTQKELADLIGAKHNSISDWENDKNKPDIDTIELLCGVLDIIPNYLMGNKTIKEQGEIAGSLIADIETIELIEKYNQLSENDRKAIKQIIFSLSKAED